LRAVRADQSPRMKRWLPIGRKKGIDFYELLKRIIREVLARRLRKEVHMGGGVISAGYGAGYLSYEIRRETCRIRTGGAYFGGYLDSLAGPYNRRHQARGIQTSRLQHLTPTAADRLSFSASYQDCREARGGEVFCMKADRRISTIDWISQSHTPEWDQETEEILEELKRGAN